ncbi:TPA: hypothetical protein ACRZ6V_001227 [Vibrio harveyi]
MIVLDKLRDMLTARLSMTTIMEPSNATARRHIRIMATNVRLTPIARQAVDAIYQPYACEMDLVISYRISGGNVNEALTRTSLSESLLITEMLTHRAIDIEDVAEDIRERDPIKKAHPDWELKVVGDGLLYGAARVGDGYANMSQFNDQDEIADEMMAYEDKWTAKLVLTVHRYFPNPRLKHITLVNDDTKEEITIEHSTSDEERALGCMG